MSIDPSLRTKGGLAGVRSVFKRSERIAKMQADKKIDIKKDSPLGLPKTNVGKH